jgi:deoxyribodipyrimidine photo-lyase
LQQSINRELIEVAMQKVFANRAELINYVQTLSPWAEGEASPTIGGYTEALKKLAKIDPIRYAETRNYGNGAATHLSPYISHGILTLHRLREYALAKNNDPQQISKFIQQLTWRDFWQRVHRLHPDWIWQDIEPYKTGFAATEYADHLPADIAKGQTGIASLDCFIQALIQTGYVHNHARLYLASYVVHFRRIKWQVGARWFLHHLLDGDLASNNFSWQWVASTFSHKPYIFNLENVAQFFQEIDTSPINNREIDASYADLSARLFPRQSGEL